jgi:Circularly permutated YpsA SLOG family
MKPVPKIVSGGQTGADPAALDWALAHGVSCGGWCPKGRKAEDGPIDPKYSLKESPLASYVSADRMNVRDSRRYLFILNQTYLGLSKLPGLFSVPRHSGLRSLLASDKARFTPVKSKSLQ